MDANSPSSYATSASTPEDHPTVGGHRRRDRRVEVGVPVVCGVAEIRNLQDAQVVPDMEVDFRLLTGAAERGSGAGVLGGGV